MSESVVARLREHVAYARHTSRDYLIATDALAALLDIVEAMADQDNPYTVAVLSDEGIWRCEWCGGWREGSRKQHAPNCAYRRARELCGMDGDA